MSNAHLDQAAELAPLIERVHGANHPELGRVRELTEQVHAEVAGSNDSAKVSELFGQLRSVTKDYAVPADGCEAYQGTYAALKQADAELTA